MKKLLFLLLLSGFVFAQITVKTIPNSRSSLTIMNNQTITGATTPTWSDAFPISFMEGATTLFFNTDTTASTLAANLSDSCLTVFLQIKDNTIGWTSYYNDTNTYTRLDSIARSVVNTSGTHDFRINLPNISASAWSPGDSARVGITIGTGDKMFVTITKQGF